MVDSAGGGRNRTGVHGFAGLGWILLNQMFSAISLSPFVDFGHFMPMFFLVLFRCSESDFSNVATGFKVVRCARKTSMATNKDIPIFRSEGNKCREYRIAGIVFHISVFTSESFSRDHTPRSRAACRYSSRCNRPPTICTAPRRSALYPGFVISWKSSVKCMPFSTRKL